MAANEIKSVNVAPNEEESTINLWQSFGWELMGAPQEIRTSDASHLERRGDTIYNVTKAGEHYVKITFQRDPARQNYSELVSLEKQYYDVRQPMDEPKRIGCLWWILCLIGWFLVYAIIAALSNQMEMSMSLALAVPIAIIIWRLKSYSERHKPYDEAESVYYDSRKEILEKARALV